MGLLERCLAGLGIGCMRGDSCGSADIVQPEQFTVGV
jgi:hypothetical protein